MDFPTEADLVLYLVTGIHPGHATLGDEESTSSVRFSSRISYLLSWCV